MQTRGAAFLMLVWLVGGAAGQLDSTDRMAEQVRKLDSPVTVPTALKGVPAATMAPSLS